MLGNGPYLLGNVPHVLGNGPQMLGKSTFGLVSHSGLRYCTVCGIRNFFAFRILSHWVLCCIRGYVVRYYVVRHYVAFGIVSSGIMSFSVMSFSLLSVYLMTIYGTQRRSSYPLSTVILICGSNSMAVARSEGV